MPNTLHLLHSVGAWRAYLARVDARADAEAIAAGLTVEDLGRGVRRYRDPALDRLAAHRAHLSTSPYAEVRNGEEPNGDDATLAEVVEAIGARPWSTPTLTPAGRSR